MTAGWLTNNFATLKKMNCLVIEPSLSSTSEIVMIETGREEYKVDWWDDAHVTDIDPTTNAFPLSSFAFYEEGEGSHDKANPASSSWDETKYYGKTIGTGAGTVRMSFTVGNTNAWLRGHGSPKVVREARVWCELGASATYEDYSRNGDTGQEWDVSSYTNATVLLDLGEARWACATTNSQLVYEIDMDIRSVYASLVTLAPWMQSPSEVEYAATVPSLDGSFGTRRKSKGMNLEGATIYLVLDLKPVASLEGW